MPAPTPSGWVLHSHFDELMAPQNILASNQMLWITKYYEDYDNLGCDLMDMWRRPAIIGRGFQTCANCKIYMGESAHKSDSEFNSSKIWNPGKVDLKTDAHVTYDIQSGCS
jgi:hypothetical protein